MSTWRKVGYCLIAAVAAFGARAEQSDDWLSVSDDTAVIRTFGTRHILIFTNTASAATVTLKKAMTLDEYLLVGGGGAGGNGTGDYGAGGGGGGVVYAKEPQSVAAATELIVTVGAGGLPASGPWAHGGSGGHSKLEFGGRTIAGYGGSGGAGNNEGVPAAENYGEVGSGGGGSRPTYGPVGTEWWQWNPTQGNKGVQGGDGCSGGGGGAGSEAFLDFGGEGLRIEISGEPVVYGSGGGGGLVQELGIGGKGGTNAGCGHSRTSVGATSGKDSTGGGGGGGGGSVGRGARGGSGTVILVLSEAAETVSRFVVQPIEDRLLVEEDVCPEVVVKDAESGEVLPSSAYTVTYANNGSAGRAVAVVQGAANTDYAGYTAIGPFAVHAVAYEDDNLVASDASVSNVVVGDRHVYIFTNVSEKIVFRTKRMLTRDRMLLVGGGGGGGGIYGGGGGGGGYVANDTLAFFEQPTEGVLKVGEGAVSHAARGNHGAPGRQGGHSWLNFGSATVYAYGGGGGAAYLQGAPKAAVYNEIGSAGGGAGSDGNYYNPEQGHACGNNPGSNAGAGGGGAYQAGRTISDVGFFGGEGMTNDITGVAVVYGSGGGGCYFNSYPDGAGKGGTNAGDGRPQDPTSPATSGVDGTGGGGGGAGSGSAYACGGGGGSGTVVLSFLVGDYVHYRDEFILTEDRSVRRIDKQGSIVYVFTNAVATQAVQVLKQLRVKRALLVGGGGGGGTTMGGGGGGGGVTEAKVRRVLEAGTEFSVCVGAGGQGHEGPYEGNYPSGGQGGCSTLTVEGLSLIAFGGGGGAGFGRLPRAAENENEIGSGGGASSLGAGSLGSQWCQGERGGGGSNKHGGGGGGMLSAGGAAAGDVAGHGGEGVTNLITGVAVVYGSGGGGGTLGEDPGWEARVPGEGGTNAGRGGKFSGGENGVDGTGSGGGGGGWESSHVQFAGGNGGCGTVILEVTPVWGTLLLVR